MGDDAACGTTAAGMSVVSAVPIATAVEDNSAKLDGGDGDGNGANVIVGVGSAIALEPGVAGRASSSRHGSTGDWLIGDVRHIESIVLAVVIVDSVFGGD